MANSPSIVLASLSDDQLKKSIDSLVTHVDEAMKKMVQSTNNAVGEMEAKLKSLGNLKIDSGGSADGGSSKRAKAQNEETDAVEKNVAARDKQIKKNQEAAMSFDNFAKAQQVAIRSASPSGIRNADTLQTMNIQLDLLRERLREARQQYSSFVALAAHATTTGDKGLFQYATDGVHRYEQEVRNLIPQIRTLQSGIQQMGDVIAPQGHTIQNYVNSLQKANPELTQLNEQFKRGKTLLQQQKTEFEQNAQAQRNSANATNQQKQSLDDMNAYIRQNIQREQERREAIRQTGLAARETADQLIRSAHEQASVQGNSPITGIKEITVAVEQMRRAYFDMSASEKTSPVGMALEADIKRANDAIAVIRKYNQSLLGTEQRNSNNITNTSTLSSLRESLKNLTDQYNKLTVAELNAGKGDALIQHFQDTTRAAQILQRTLNRPVSLKAALAGDERTLDDIAYKMQRLSSYRSGLDTNAQHNEIRRVNYEYDVLKKKMDEIMQKNSQMISSNTALGRSWNYMKNRLAFYFTVGASTQFIKNLIEVRSQYEMNERALGILVDSAERGTQIFRELSDMALVSPYTLIELSSAAKQLTAYDVAAKDVVDTTRRLADMASAVGVPVERLTYALGQIKAYGYLNSRDARMFANAGIPLVKELADHYTRLEGRLVSTADIYDRIKKKAIDYNDVMQVMNEMTDEGGKFYDFQAKMADTLKVQLANLTLAWNNMLNDLGNSQQGLLTSGIGALKELFLHWKDLDRILTNLAVTIGTAKAAQLLLNMSFGKGTLAAIKNISAIEGNTAAMYENALSKSNLSKAEARWLVSTNSSNVALRAAMVNMKLLTAEEAKAAASTTVLGVRMGWLGRVMKTNFFGIASVVRGAAVGMEMLGKAMLSIVTNPVFLAITAAMSLVDALLYYNQIAEKTAEMNKAIADNAKEASEAIGDYLKDSVNIGNRAKAAQGVLSVSEGQKAWESIREQIELSSDAASVFISKLLEEEDINKRVKEGFDVAESIREATNAMAGLNAEALKVSQDSWLWGAFGEGLAEDLEDYIEAVQRGRKNGANIGSRYFAAGEYNEAMRELTAFANDAETIIRDRLGAGVKDAVQLKEAIERVKKEVIAANPQIKGEVKKWFDVEIDRMMAERFGGVYNELSSIQSQFIEHIKHDSGAALRRLSDDILDTSKELDDDVLGAISKAWDKLKDELPAESQDLISKLQKQMDENPLTLRVLLLQAGEQQIRDAIQKDYEQHFYDSNIGEKPTRPKDVGSLWGDYKGDYKAFAAAQEKHEKEMVEYNQKNAEWEAKRAEYVAKYGDFNKKNDETRAKWAKRVNDEIKAADAEEKAAKHARESLEAELSLEERKTDARYLSAVQEEQAAKDRKSAAQEAWNYEKLYQEEKGKGRKGSKKDPLLDALKQEISLVEKLQSDYDKLSKSGASQADALDTIRGAYGKTIRLLNTQLQSYGLPQIDISQLITGKDPNKALAHFKQTLDTLVSKGMLTLERSKELEAVVEKFTLSAKTYNLDMITKGLNNKLGKLKDEYELAVELDADPELGNMFTDMFRIDTTDFPKTIDEYMQRIQQEFDKMREKRGFGEPLNIFKADDAKWESWGRNMGLVVDVLDENKNVIDKNTDALDKLTPKFKEAQGVAKKWAQDTIKTTQDLEYKLGDLAKKIEIEKAKLAVLEDEAANNTNAAQKRLLELRIQEQKEAIEKLKMESIKLLPFYEDLFGDMYNVSVGRLKEIAKAAKEVMTPRQGDSGVGYTQRTDNKGKVVYDIFAKDKQGEIKKTTISLEEFIKINKQVDSVQQKIAESSPWEKIKDSFSKKNGGGLKNFASGMEAVGGELQKVANITKEIGGFAEALGADENTVEIINDIATSIGGVATAAQGIGQIASGDYIGGAASVASGLFSAISTWFDNSDKEILQKIKESEREVKKLENSYKDLEYAIEQAYGMAEYGARRAAIANRQLQLVELQRQLRLEQSRDSKHRDEDRILELKGQIIDLRNEIAKSIDDITNDMLGISSVGNAAEELVSSMIDAFKQGEDYMLQYDESFEKMIDNMIMKAIVSRVVGDRIEQMWNQVKAVSESRGNADRKRIEELTKQLSKAQDGQMDIQSFVDKYIKDSASAEKILKLVELAVERIKAELAKAEKDYAKAIEPTKDDVDNMREMADGWREDVKNEFEYWMGAFGIGFGEGSDKQLSNLQQGIQGITEDTAGALEAYMNGVSQQVYLHSDLLTQIRDAVVGMDMDIQVATQAQMLLQLQQSYAVQMAIQGILEGWNNPSGQAVRVELVS